VIEHRPPPLPIDRLIADYDGFLIDAYGVLVDRHHALPGAVELIEQLERHARPWLVVTNSASRLPEALALELSALGVPVPADRVLTSGELLAPHLAEVGLTGARGLLLGPAQSWGYLDRAGLERVAPAADADAEVIVVADQRGVCFPDDLDHCLSLMIRRLEADQPLALVLCNPDLLYPVGDGRYGLTAGALAALMEAVLRERWPERGVGFVRLGKPNAPIYAEGCRRLGASRPLMIGDQLVTDILGAVRFGIDSLLIGSGLARGSPVAAWPVRPTWYLPSLAG
jgi:HAD superfamily hydrolase (TIGR01459 family)